MSCLHAIEHMGLGRYGDPISSSAVSNALQNMSLFLKKDGKLYLSTPLGKSTIYYNANYVFDPNKLIASASLAGLDLLDLTLLDPRQQALNYLDLNNRIDQISSHDYCLCLLELVKR